VERSVRVGVKVLHRRKERGERKEPGGLPAALLFGVAVISELAAVEDQVGY